MNKVGFLILQTIGGFYILLGVLNLLAPLIIGGIGDSWFMLLLYMNILNPSGVIGSIFNSSFDLISMLLSVVIIVLGVLFFIKKRWAWYVLASCILFSSVIYLVVILIFLLPSGEFGSFASPAVGFVSLLIVFVILFWNRKTYSV